MKKLIALCLTLFLSAGILTTGVSASFGTGAAVVAADVKLIKTGLRGERLSFSDADFKSALCLADFDTVTVTRIPSSREGALVLGGRRVGEGKAIKRQQLSSLIFMPASDGVTECSFAFTVDGYAGGAEIECLMKFIDKVNYAPKAGEDGSSASIRTQAEIPVYGRLSGSDPEGDGLEFIIVSYPARGIVRLTDSESGEYCYTPYDGFVGNDRFEYVVRDEYGNWSLPTEVSVRVNRRMCTTVYRDMEDRAEYNAAVAMTAMGVMDGSMVGDDMYFSPDEAVTRAEFVAMAMKCVGLRPDGELSASYFDDDKDIPVSLKGYVATAQRMGLIVGDFKDGELLFSPNDGITKYEAAKIMAMLIGAEESDEEEVFASDKGVPVWARAGVSAMCELGIFDAEEAATETATRAEVASYLYRLTDYVK